MKYRITFTITLDTGERIRESTIIGTDTPKSYIAEYAAREGEYRAQECMKERGLNPNATEYDMTININPTKRKPRRRTARK